MARRGPIVVLLIGVAAVAEAGEEAALLGLGFGLVVQADFFEALL